jgi:hypothetical protein
MTTLSRIKAGASDSTSSGLAGAIHPSRLPVGPGQTGVTKGDYVLTSAGGPPCLQTGDSTSSRLAAGDRAGAVTKGNHFVMILGRRWSGPGNGGKHFLHSEEGEIARAFARRHSSFSPFKPLFPAASISSRSAEGLRTAVPAISLSCAPEPGLR